MANFCNQCGSPLQAGPFCNKCGADARKVPASTAQAPAAAQPPVAAPLIPAQAAPVQATPAAPAKSSLWLKIILAVVVVLFVCGALAVAGVIYAAHRVSQKVHEVTQELASNSADADAPAESLGDVCRFLSQEEVSKAIGVEIVSTKAEGAGCSYLAKGDQADMTARHATALAASKGADKQAQQALQQFAGGMFKAMQDDNKEKSSDPSGQVVVMNFSIDQNSAGTQMKLNNKVMGMLGPNGAQRLSGIGDEAFVTADTMLMFRKGNKMVRIMYMTCPCGTEAIRPLARQLADRL